MSTSDAQKKAAEKYIKEKTDEIKVRVPKGRKAVIQAHVANIPNETVNGFINKAIDEKIGRDNESTS